MRTTKPGEALDHELHRLPVTRSMKLAVEAEARRRMITAAQLQRIALAELLASSSK